MGKNPESVRHFTFGDSRIEVQGQVDRRRPRVGPRAGRGGALLSGSGTRLKILEAWAAGLPVVSTTVGVEGLPVGDGETHFACG